MKNNHAAVAGLLAFILFCFIIGVAVSSPQRQKVNRGADFVYYFTARPAWQRNQVRWSNVVWAEDWNYEGSREPFYILHLSDGTALTVRDTDALSVISERLKDGQ